MEEVIINEVTFSMLVETEEPEKDEEDEKFDWNDQRRKKEEKNRENHAKYFSPLSAFCEMFADSQNEDVKVNKILPIEKPVTKEDAAKERHKYLVREGERKLKLMEKQKVKPANRNMHESQMNKIKACIENSKAIVSGKEKQLNQQRIEAHQEQIIELEEYIPAYNNMPREEFLKEGKTRRRLITPILEQKVVHCKFCKGTRRSVQEILEHMHQIHRREFNELIENSDTKKEEEKTEAENVQTMDKKGEKLKTKVLDIKVECMLEDDGNVHLRLDFDESNSNSNDRVNCLPPQKKTKKVESAKNYHLLDVEKDNEVILLDCKSLVDHQFEDSEQLNLCESEISVTRSSSKMVPNNTSNSKPEKTISVEVEADRLPVKEDVYHDDVDHPVSAEEPVRESQVVEMTQEVKKPNFWSRLKQVTVRNIHSS